MWSPLMRRYLLTTFCGLYFNHHYTFYKLKLQWWTSVWAAFIKCVNLVNQVFFILLYKTDLQALYLGGTYGHKTSTRPPSCATPQELTIHEWYKELNQIYKSTHPVFSIWLVWNVIWSSSNFLKTRFIDFQS